MSSDLVDTGDISPSQGEFGDFEDDETNPPAGEDDLYVQLAQKERDLTLAAELGKALLEKNEELERKQDLMVDEFTQKLEELEQEKYELHLKLEKSETEYENTIKELQYDVSQLRHELQTQQHQNSTGTKERSDAMRELAQQNERLSEDMKHAELREDELSSQVQMLRDQVLSRKSSLHTHITRLEELQGEIGVLTQKNLELESRIHTVTEERDSLACNLEESQERVLVLEKHNREKELQLQNQERDILELQETNMQLESQLHHMSSNFLHPRYHSNHQSQNLFSELSQMSSPSPPPELTTQSSGSEDGYNHHMALAEWMEEDDFECDDELQLNTVGTDVPVDSTIMTDSQFLSNFQCTTNMDTDNDDIHQELIHVYSKLKQMCQELHSSGHPQNQIISTELAEIQPGSISLLLDNLRELMQEMIAKPLATDSCTDPEPVYGEEFCMSDLQGHIQELHSELQAAHGDLDRVKDELKGRDAQLHEKSQELSQLTSKLTLQHNELTKLQSQRDKIHGATYSQYNREETVEKARRDRDQAIEKQNKMEIELAKAKMDLLSLNNQLMEAIQQKMALSEQLDQWQVDMEELIDLQIKKRNDQETDKEQVLDELKQQISLRKSKSTSSF